MTAGALTFEFAEIADCEVLYTAGADPLDAPICTGVTGMTANTSVLASTPKAEDVPATTAA